MSDINIVPINEVSQKRIGVVCLPGLESFLPAIVDHLKKDYVVRTCYSRSVQDIESIVAWADLVWIEWCNELAIEMTNKLVVLAGKKVVIRLHSYEALSNYVPAVNWKVVDSVIFVADHIKDIVLKQFPKLAALVEMHVVNNGV